MHIVFSFRSTAGVPNVLDFIATGVNWFPGVSNEACRTERICPVSEQIHNRALLQTHICMDGGTPWGVSRCVFKRGRAREGVEVIDSEGPKYMAS